MRKRERWIFDRRCVQGCCYRWNLEGGDALDYVSVDVGYFWASPAERRAARDRVLGEVSCA